MKLYYKILFVFSILIVGIIALITLTLNAQFNASIETQMSNAALDMAKSIAYREDIAFLLSENDPDHEINGLVETIRQDTKYQYIIVMDMSGIQYSYPYSSGLYKPYKNGGEEQAITEGIAYASLDNNELISAVRAFVPIDYKGEQVGVLLVGLLTDQLQMDIIQHRRIMETVLVFGLLVGLMSAYLLAKNIKNSTFGLEPKDMAQLLAERELIINNIQRGLIAIDASGKINLINDKARLMFNIPCDKDEVTRLQLGVEINDLIKEAMKSEENILHRKIMVANNLQVLASLCRMMDSSGKYLGAVISIETLTYAQKLADEVTNYRELTDSLRAQNHEFMNKLQTISGLIQLEKYETVLSYIDVLSKQNQRLKELLTEQIRNNSIAALLLSKYEICSEKKVAMVISTESQVTGLPKGLGSEEAVTIIGNLIENSIEALEGIREQRIEILVESDENEFYLEIYNSGPKVSGEMADIVRKGFSTKGKGRGYGLSLISSIVSAHEGTFRFENDEGVTWYVKIN